MDYAAYEYYLSALLNITALFGMGATLTVRHFWDVVRAPYAVLLAIAVQVLISPCLALGLAWLLGLPIGTSVGLLLIAALPGGLFSNIFTYLGRGNVALSVTATAVATLGSLVTTTLVLKTFGYALGWFGHVQLPENFSMPLGRIVSEISLCLLLPLCLGMIVRRAAPRRHATIAKLFIRISLVILAVFVVSAIFSGRIKVTEYGWLTPIALILFSVISFWICYALGYLIRLPLVDSFTVGIECVVRNVQLGLLLNASLFPQKDGDPIGGGVLFALLFYGGSCLVVAGWEIWARVKRIGPIHGRAAAERNNASDRDGGTADAAHDGPQHKGDEEQQ